jgi:hypothetical protein
MDAMLNKLIASLTDEERAALTLLVRNSASQTHKLIRAFLEKPDLSQQHLSANYGINNATYFKNLSLAREEIYEVIKMHMRNAYDDMILANLLYRRGLEVYASKLRLKLEEEYERYGWWNVLQELYTMEMMVAYSKCDIKRLEVMKGKIFKNQERLDKFIRIDKELIVQLAKIEQGDLKEKEFPQFHKKLDFLRNEAHNLGHPIPVFNALHTSYIFYTQYQVDVARAGEIIRETAKFLKKYDESIIPYTKAVAWLNGASFAIDFAISQPPVTYLKQLEKVLGTQGILYDAQAVLAFCYYSFLQKNKQGFEKYFTRFLNLPTDKSFQYKIAYLNCLKAYLNNDVRVFNNHRNEFYTGAKNRDYNDYDLIIRYLEMLLLLRLNDKNLVADKLEATIKFIRRNFTGSRIKLEKSHWNMISAAVHARASKNDGPHVYRLSKFIADELKSI